MQSAALARQAQEHLRGAVFKDKSISDFRNVEGCGVGPHHEGFLAFGLMEL